MATEIPLGFDGVTPEEGAGGTGSTSPADFTVQFTPAADIEESETHGKEDIQLLDVAATSPTEEEKKLKEQTVMFDDGVTSIDFILTYQDTVDKRKDKDTEERKDKRLAKRTTFLENCRKAGLVFEHQDCNESPDRKTHYLKVHGKHDALLKGAEDMLLRMPIRENNLKVASYRERFFDAIKLKDPFEPKIPRHLERTSYFSAPFNYDRRANFLGWDDEKNFFTSAQRGAIVHFILLNQRYGTEDDQVGLLRLLANHTFTSAYPLHESAHKLTSEQSDEDMTDRTFLYHRWSYWTNWYRRQPLDQIRRYFGEKVGIYFTWLGFYTTWLLPASIVGFIVFLYGLSRVVNPIADDICNDRLRYEFYMCPRCDGRCDFWFLGDSCTFSRLALIFDNGATVFFAIFMSFWAVLFLEFWKRRQYFLQYDWDVLGFEESEQRARPQFEQKIKNYIRKCKTEDAKKKFTVRNPVLDKDEYIQPTYWYWPKIVGTFSILITMVAVVIAVVFLVILYRLAVAGLIYRLVSGLPLGPSIGDIVVSITGAAIQLVAIIVMNKLYEFLAYHLTNWELHRTQTDYDDSFITKMYLFQFVNFYASLFYVAFFKGNLTGVPGDYNRIAGLRVDECATYGCLLELTIQLFIIMVGKQVLNNCQELAIPYVKRIVNCLKHKEEDETDVYARWERDYDLIPLNQHGLFFEYLELVIQYGFITIFVAALPLAPLFALLNNWIEIRLDAHKFVVVLRRPVAERAGDIGAWFGILSVVSQLAVVTNAFLIAITAQFIPFEVYARGGHRIEGGRNSLSGFVNWSLAEFTLDKLIDGEAFPAFSAQELQLYSDDGEILPNSSENALYLPYVDFDCILETYPSFAQYLRGFPNITTLVANTSQQYMTVLEEDYRNLFVDDESGIFNTSIRSLILNVDDGDSSPVREGQGPCFVGNVTCRFRGYEQDGGFEGGDINGTSITTLGATYWQVQTARLAFVVVFEHFIFVIAGFLAYLVPDVPQSVKNEIQREKLLAYEAVHARAEKGQDIAEIRSESGDDGGTTAI